MEESLGPEWRDLLIETYMTCSIDEFDDLWHDAVKELTLMSMEECEDSDSDEEEELQDALLLRTLLLEVGVLVSGLNLAVLNFKFRKNLKKRDAYSFASFRIFFLPGRGFSPVCPVQGQEGSPVLQHHQLRGEGAAPIHV